MSSRLIKSFIVLTITNSIVACGGGGGADPIATQQSPPPITPTLPAVAIFDCDSKVPEKGSEVDVSPGGIYFGRFVDCATGARANATAMIGEDGVFRISSYDNEIYNLAGSLQIDGDSFQGASHSFAEPGVFAGLWLEGVIVKRGSLEGHWGNEWGGYGYFQLAYSGSYEWPDAWMSLMQYRELREAQNGTQFRWTIGDDGQISDWGKTGTIWNETNCTYNGQAVQRDPRFNLFEIEYTAADCTLAGSYSGLATVLLMGDDTEQAPVLQFQVDDGEEGMQMVVKLYGYY